ncbi:MAG TPA: hypothetical protein P5277_03905 [Candidatus Paceibacterota bacterium]|nr:hypothetical protein [Candidatus Paceibacterota bacterium]
MENQYEERNLIVCIVKDVVKTTVFVETEEGIKGSINFSEVAPGRIRNIRDYVVPNKIVVCKILSFKDNHLFLSIRRVKENEKKELLDKYKKEKTIISLIKKNLGEKAETILEKIREETKISELFENAKKDQSILSKYFSKNEIESLSGILKEKEKKEKEIKREFSLSCKEHDGISKIKKILSSYNNIYYLGSSKFIIKTKSIDLKHADSELNQIIESIEKQSKKEKCEFALIKSK